MLLKIEREVCLAKYRNFPLSPYDPNTDEEVLYYPKTFDGGWYTLDSKSKKEFPGVLKAELTEFFMECGFEHLIFFGDKTTPWITKLPASRTGDKSIGKAVQYFKENKLGKKFNGGVQVGISDLPEFITHFFCITCTDASFHEFHFSDPWQNMLGFIHPGGEVLLQCLKEDFNKKFSDALLKTKFKPTSR